MKAFGARSVVFGLALLAQAWLSSAASTAKPKSHGQALEGKVVSVTASRSFALRTAAGVEATLQLTKATHIKGGPLKPGDSVAVRYLEKDGKKIATSVEVVVSEAATPTATALGAR